MKFTKTLKIALVIAIALSIGACAATPTRRSFNESWKDSIVSTKITYKMTSDKVVKKRSIHVDVWRGVVTLTGHVRSESEKERAAQIAWKTAGVREVDNYLKPFDDLPAPEGEQTAEKDLKPEKATKSAVVAKKELPVDLAIEDAENFPVVKSKVASPAKAAATKTAAKQAAVAKKATPKKTADVATTKTAPKAATKVETPLAEKPATAKIPAAEQVASEAAKKPVITVPEAKNATPAPATAKPAANKTINEDETLWTKRSDYKQPTTSNIKEEDLTSEQKLANDAAKELKKLRGEEPTESDGY